MSKRILLTFISLISVMTMLSVNVLASPEQWATSVNYYVYKNNTVQHHSGYGEDNIQDMYVPLFQIREDGIGIRSDGWIMTCDTTVDLTGVTKDNSVEISYQNYVGYNGGSQTLNGAYNRLNVTLMYNDGTEQVYYYSDEGTTLGYVPLLQIGDVGTIEYNDELCVTFIKGVALDRVKISIELFADTNNPTPIPMSIWQGGQITFGEISRVEQIVEGIANNQNVLIHKMEQITTPNIEDEHIIDNMQSNIANKGEQSDQLLEDSKVEKPIVSDDVLNPMDKVDDEALDNMGGMIGAVFVSPTLGSIALLTLTFAFLGFILYGKR